MKYRDHTGSIEKSLETTIQVDSLEVLKDHLSESWSKFDWDIDQVRFDYVGFDKRTGWDTYCVMVKFSECPDWIPVGWSDGIFENPIKKSRKITVKSIEIGESVIELPDSSPHEVTITLSETRPNFDDLKKMFGK